MDSADETVGMGMQSQERVLFLEMAHILRGLDGDVPPTPGGLRGMTLAWHQIAYEVARVVEKLDAT